MAITSVVLVGANGHLGPSILRTLLEHNTYKVSVLTRASSTSAYPETVHILRTDDDLPADQLVQNLKGQDALIIAFAGTQKDNSIKLVNAAFKAGVKHVIPADFGSCDSSDERSLSLMPLYVNKKDVRDHLVHLSQQPREDGTFMSWTSLITGHFFDYGLRSGLLSMDVQKGTARVFDDGRHKFAATVLATIGRATATLLENADHPRLHNKLVYIQSIQTTQHELVRAVEKIIGRQIRVENVNSNDFIAEHKSLLDKNVGDPEITEELVSVEGLVNTNWDTKGDAYVNDLLHIKPRDLEELVAEALR